MTTAMSVMSGELGDIFWDLPPWIAYAPGYDLGCSIYVANPTDTEKQYALMARLTRDGTVLSEEALPVFGYTWFTVDPGDFVRLHGALRFSETGADLAVLLVEKETEEVADSVATRLVAASTSGLPPGWPAPGTSGSDWSSLLFMMLPMVMLGMVAASVSKADDKPVEEEKKTVSVVQERKLLPPGREA